MKERKNVMLDFSEYQDVARLVITVAENKGSPETPALKVFLTEKKDLMKKCHDMYLYRESIEDKFTYIKFVIFEQYLEKRPSMSEVFVKTVNGLFGILTTLETDEAMTNYESHLFDYIAILTLGLVYFMEKAMEQLQEYETRS